MVSWAQIPERKIPTQPLRDAMWSIYFHSMFRSGLKAPALVRDHGLEPLPLREAVDTLVDSSTDKVRPSRALRKLIAAGLHKPRRLDVFLGDTEGAATRRSIERLARLVDVDLRSLDQLEPSVALNFLQVRASKSSSNECRISPGSSSCVACHDGLSLNTTVKGQVEVNRDPDDLLRVVDPRCWDECHLFFLQAYRTEQNPNPDDSWPEHPENSTTEPGTEWTGFLYEMVQAGPVIFENVLKITRFSRSPDLIVLAYDEHRSWRTHFPLPLGEQIGGIEIDFGETRVERVAPGSSRIRISKTVRFADFTSGSSGTIDYGELLNYWVPAMLCLWVDEEIEISPCCPGP